MPCFQPTPKMVHFVYFSPNSLGDFQLNIIQYISIKSVIIRNPEYIINFHCSAEPTGDLWLELKPFVEVIFAVLPKKVFDIDIIQIEHRVDVFRLNLLIEFGGIYLDTDTITLRSLDQFIRLKPVMGREGDAGLCNAVIFSPPNSEFLRRWYALYRDFHNDQWNEFSVLVPKRLAVAAPDLIDVEPETTFFMPSFDPKSAIDLFDRLVDFPDAFIFHLWNTMNRTRLAEINVSNILHDKTTFGVAAREVLQAKIGGGTLDEEFINRYQAVF